jgi:hypothetical protein
VLAPVAEPVLGLFLLSCIASGSSAPPPLTWSPPVHDTFLFSPTTTATLRHSDELTTIISPPPPVFFYTRNWTHIPIQFEGRTSMMEPGWIAVGQVQVKEGNRITRFPCGEINGGGEPELGPLGLGLLVEIVGDGGSS